MITRARGWLLLLTAGVLLAASAPARAQCVAPPPVAVPPQTPVVVETAGGEVTVVADRMEQVGPDGLVIATGNVEITRGASRLLADRVEIDRATGDAVAEGRVIFYDGDNQLTGERIEYNLRTGTGVVYQADARAEPYYRLRGREMERLSESVYRIREGRFTTCEDEPPTWSFRFGSATADLNDYVYGTSASFWVKNVPLIPFFPAFAAAIRRERQTGFLFPKFGERGGKGFYVETPFFWAIDESTDATISPIYYTNRGPGITTEFRYVLSESERGRADVFFLQETAHHDASRFSASVFQELTLARRTWLKVDAHVVSDDHVLRDYGDSLRQVSSQRVESHVFLTRSWDTWNLVGDLFWYQDLTTRRPTELWRLPDISLVGPRQPIPFFRDSGVLFQSTNSFVHFVREIGSDGSRLDLRPQFSRPFSLGGYATLTPFVGGRLTAYDRTVTGLRESRSSGLLEETRDELRLRRQLEVGTDLESKVSRVFMSHGWWGTEALLHTIEPRIRYGRIWSAGENRLPLWTLGVDDVEDTSRLEYSLTNRIRARTAAVPGTEPSRWELLRLTLGHTYDLRGGRPGDAFSTLIVEPRPGIRLRSDVTYDPLAQNIPSATADLSASEDRASGAIGIRYSEPSRITFLQGGFRISPLARLGLRSTVNWDLRRGEFSETRVAADLRWQCWALTVEYVNRINRDDEIRFAVNLLGVGGPIGTSVGLGTIATGAR